MEPREIMNKLIDIADTVKNCGDTLQTLCKSTEDIDIVVLIDSLASQAYELSQDVRDSVENYKEIISEYDASLDDEELDPEVEEDLEPSVVVDDDGELEPEVSQDA